jgi:bifunctional DNA-binding transcriptional regulator/antitoxin component of YhaV-PrlF toxin-antitoxin module
MTMRRLKISKGGQVSVPADVRKRWNTSTVIAEDLGDHLVLRPVPDDPIEATRGIFKHLPMTSEEMRRNARAEEREIYERREKARRRK